MAAKRKPVIEHREHPPLLCATAGCPNEARVRVRHYRAEWAPNKPNPIHVPYGPWSNLCHACDDRKHHAESVEYCKLMGLDTWQKQREWCLRQLKRGAEMLRPEPRMREPGEDTEERNLQYPRTQ